MCEMSTVSVFKMSDAVVCFYCSVHLCHIITLLFNCCYLFVSSFFLYSLFPLPSFHKKCSSPTHGVIEGGSNPSDKGTGKPSGSDKKSDSAKSPSSGAPSGSGSASGTGTPSGSDNASGSGAPSGSGSASGSGDPPGPGKPPGSGGPSDGSGGAAAEDDKGTEDDKESSDARKRSGRSKQGSQVPEKVVGKRRVIFSCFDSCMNAM